MLRTRLLFSKTGRAKYISHLDLLRTFQRVFLRAGVKLRHTEGFNPHPYMTFALPLSVGCESICEMLDFDLVVDSDLDVLPELLNRTMPEGIKAIKAYPPEKKFSDIVWLEVAGSLIYDEGVRAGTVDALTALFGIKELVISKKSKKGNVDTDIIPFIDCISFTKISGEEITMHAVITAQNPSLNPEHLMTAVRVHLPSDAPDYASFRRTEVYNSNHNIYR